MVGWIEAPDDKNTSSGPVEYQLVALTYAGGWYRLSLPTVRSSKATASAVSIHAGLSTSPPKSRQRTSSGSSALSRFDKGKEKEKKDGEKQSRKCVLEEYRRFGRWDGWG
jgi:hypothetical protein